MIQAKNKKHKNWYQGFQGLDTQSALGELGDLGRISKQHIKNNGKVLKRILEEEREPKPNEVLSFDEVVRQYNQGITEDELKAWVWYQRGQGEKMEGWEKYFLNLGHEVTISVHVKSEGELSGQKPTLYDKHYRDLMEVQFGELVGTFTGEKQIQGYDQDTYLIVKTDHRVRGGLPKKMEVMILEKAVETYKHEGSIDAPILKEYVQKGILYYMAGQLLPHPIYAFGNMYDRELQLAKDQDYILEHYGKEVYERQHHMVMNPTDKGGLRPRLLSVLNPDLTQRPKILSISKFAKEFTISSLKEDTNVFIDEEITVFEAFKLWLKKVDSREFKNVKYNEIVKYYLDGNNLSQRLTDDQKMGIEKYAMLEAEEFFVTFLHKALTFEDQQKVDFTWNRIYNGHSSIPYHKVPIGFACSALFKQGVLRFTQRQREAIAFMEIAKSGIIAYDVGVGKTMAAIITLANNLYSGKCLRPLIVVPNPTYGKWLREVIGYTDPKTKEFVPGVLSHVGYALNEWYNLGKDYKQINFEKEIKPKTITVMTYEGFAKLGFSNKSFDGFFEEMSAILNQVDVSGLTQREIELRNQAYREMLGMGNKNSLADVDVLGFDYIVIDEAHNFKNVFDNVMAEEGVKRFNIQGSQSTRAVKAFFICNYIQRTYGRNVMLLTATPFTNSPLEIYSMLSLVAYDYMRKNGLTNVQRFMESFVLQTLEYVNSYDDTIRQQHVVKSFNNRLILQQLIFNHIAYRTGEEAGVKRPCKINLPRLYAKDADGIPRKLDRREQFLTYLSMTPQQKENQKEIISMARSSTPGDGNLMRALSYSLDNAVSPFLFRYSLPPEDYLEFVEESPKIKYVMECIRSVKQWHEERNEPVSGQVIYLNRGKDFFGYIKQYLEKELGYKQKVKHHRDTVDEVEIITSGISQGKKETIKEAFLAGVCNVIIGTSTIREGIDLQNVGTVLYNCYPDWNPTDVRQLEGRIWRQGNKFGYVRVVMPLLQDSMDVFVFQKLEEKTSRINDIWYRGGSTNVIDLESIDPEEVKFALFSNVDALAKISLDKQQTEITRRINVADINIETLMGFGDTIKKYHGYRQSCLATLKYLLSDYTSEFFSVNHDYKHHRYFVEMTPSEQRAFLEKVKGILEETQQFFASAVQEDKEIIRLARLFANLESTNLHVDMIYFSFFRATLSEIRKAEETIMKEKGFTANDNLMDVIQAYRAEKDRLLIELNHLTSPEYKAKLYAEVRERKERMNVQGESPEMRAREFAALNHLLSYRSADVEGDSCPLPEGEIIRVQARPSEDRERKLKLLRLRAKALKLRLN